MPPEPTCSLTAYLPPYVFEVALIAFSLVVFLGLTRGNALFLFPARVLVLFVRLFFGRPGAHMKGNGLIGRNLGSLRGARCEHEALLFLARLVFPRRGEARIRQLGHGFVV